MRPARVEDVDGLLAFGMTVVVRTADDWLRAIQLCEEGSRVLHVAVVDGVIAGFGQAHRLDSDGDHGQEGYYLTGVTVLPPYRRQGLAQELTHPRLDWIRERADAAWCFVNATNDASLRLHEKLGFTEVARATSIHGVTFDGGQGVLMRHTFT
ncbi:GNAT family N-acetyltransferase [Aeromicrobium fastidiosum]|uniref:GNAT family N-acetyltransferase n=1 Tax=Aeromicrobium fastidiosum TaxID=52699 RepID=UPI001CB702F7|nr:GNAT family N-acetyltransferase [Aeromicrobium fastidiosum]MBP2391847.1 ribosomal protein S18 acetylase RimI-like enzyme [Aeromicrobium fastidiosum]